MIVTHKQAFTTQKLLYKMKQLSRIILNTERYNLQQKPVFYASYTSGIRQIGWATATVEIVS